MVLGQQALQLATQTLLLQSVANLVQIDEDVEGVIFLAGFFDLTTSSMAFSVTNGCKTPELATLWNSWSSILAST